MTLSGELTQLATAVTATYWYAGRCPTTGRWLQLPRTLEVEAIARDLMAELASDPRAQTEGKMYGVLLTTTANGEQRVLKAFSGLRYGAAQQPGWVPPLPGREVVRLAEMATLQALDTIRTELEALRQLPARTELAQQEAHFAAAWTTLTAQHRQRKAARQLARQQIQATLTGAAQAKALHALDEASRRDGRERRVFKRDRDRQLAPLRTQVTASDRRRHALKQQRRHLSRQLQAQMHAVYTLTNFAGQSRTLDAIADTALPTGTGDCCAPKLLHAAASQNLTPLALAEFWWGPPSPDGQKQPGQFYGACAERCQPLLGFLLSGLPEEVTSPAPPDPFPLTVLYADDWLVAVDKPAGLLSVPGRSSTRQDSVVTRLRHQFQTADLVAGHRLDQYTSGVLVLARDRATQRALHHQFQQQQVQKTYEALLSGAPSRNHGWINLPLWGDPRDRPRQHVNWQQGKPSQTAFRVLDSGPPTRVQFQPRTGRTHQLRVHAADPQGLGLPILGDRLYGTPGDRLYLHARQLRFTHPNTGQALQIHAPTPF